MWAWTGVAVSVLGKVSRASRMLSADLGSVNLGERDTGLVWELSSCWSQLCGITLRQLGASFFSNNFREIAR